MTVLVHLPVTMLVLACSHKARMKKLAIQNAPHVCVMGATNHDELHQVLLT